MSEQLKSSAVRKEVVPWDNEAQGMDVMPNLLARANACHELLNDCDEVIENLFGTPSAEQRRSEYYSLNDAMNTMSERLRMLKEMLTTIRSQIGVL